MIDLRAAARTALTLAIAAVGGGLLTLAGFPASWVTGGMIAVAAAAMMKVPVEIPLPVRDVAFVVIGSFLGTTVSPELLRGVVHWPLSLVVLILSVFAVHWAAELFLHRFCRWDRHTAFFAAIPGVTSYVIALALPTGADVSRIAVSQTIRVFLLVLLMPNLLSAVGSPMQPVATVGSAFDVIATLVAGAIAGTLFSFVGVPAAPLLGAMFASGALHGAGVLHGGLPLFVQIIVYLALGAVIGTRFAGTGLRTILAMLIPSFGSFAASVCISMVGAWLTGLLLPTIPLSQLVLAFAPGGIDVMTTMAFALGLDSAFVAAHQLARFLTIAVYAPLLSRRRDRKGPPQAGGGAA